jgi:chemotaxis family two-component system sensor kinase Cph1
VVLPRPGFYISAIKEDQHWLFSIRGNGIGIDPQQAGRLFQVFQRLHTPSGYPGMGIGLAICKKIVVCHGGRVWVESPLGEGSIFYFTIGEKSSQQSGISRGNG